MNEKEQRERLERALCSVKEIRSALLKAKEERSPEEIAIFEANIGTSIQDILTELDEIEKKCKKMLDTKGSQLWREIKSAFLWLLARIFKKQ